MAFDPYEAAFTGLRTPAAPEPRLPSLPRGPSPYDVAFEGLDDEEPTSSGSIFDKIKDSWRTVTSPIPAIAQTGKAISEKLGLGTDDDGNADPGRPFFGEAVPGESYNTLAGQFRAGFRGAGAAFFDEGLPGLLTPLDIATAPLPVAKLRSLGKAGEALNTGMRAAELAGGAGLAIEGAGDVVEGAQTGNLGQIGGGLFRGAMGGLMAGTRRPRIEEAIAAREAAGGFDAPVEATHAPRPELDPLGNPIQTPDLSAPVAPTLGQEGYVPPVWTLEPPPAFTPTRPHIPPPVDVLAERDFLRPNLEAEVNAEQARLGREFLQTPEMQGRNRQTYERLTPEEKHAIGVAGLKVSDVNAMPLEEAQELVRPLIQRSRKPPVSPEAEQAPIRNAADSTDPVVNPADNTATLDNTAMVGDDRRSDSVFDRRAENPPFKVAARLDRRTYGPDDRRAQIAEDIGRPIDDPAVQRVYEAETDPISQLPGPAVYDRDIKTHTGAVASMDLAGLKWVNDTLGHSTGDAFLKAVGEAANEVPGVRMYRKGGDEFVVLADTEEAADAAARSIQQRFAEAEISYRQPDGQTVTYTRGRLDYGVGQGQSGPESFAAADAALYRAREEAKARGERADRGQRPPGLVEVPASGRGTVDQVPDQTLNTPAVHAPTGAELINVVGPNGDRVVLAVKKGAKGASDFDPLVTDKSGKHELQTEKLSRRLKSADWVETLKARGYNPDEVVGFAHFGPNDKQLSPGMVYVSPELRRKGLASAIYDSAQKESGLPLGSGSQRPEGQAFRSAYDARSLPSTPLLSAGQDVQVRFGGNSLPATVINTPDMPATGPQQKGKVSVRLQDGRRAFVRPEDVEPKPEMDLRFSPEVIEKKPLKPIPPKRVQAQGEPVSTAGPAAEVGAMTQRDPAPQMSEAEGKAQQARMDETQSVQDTTRKPPKAPFNFERMNLSPENKDLLSRMYEAAPEKYRDAKGGTEGKMTFQDFRDAGVRIASVVDEKSFEKALAAGAPLSDPGAVVYAKQLSDQRARELGESKAALDKARESGKGVEDAERAYLAASLQKANMDLSLAGAQAQAARTLVAFKILSQERGPFEKLVAKIFNESCLWLIALGGYFGL